MSDILIICLFERSYTVEHRIEFYRDMLIHVALAEEPLLIAASLDDVLEESVYLKTLKHINVQAVLQRSWGLVGDYKIDCISVFCKVADSFAYLIMRGLLAFPPHIALASELIVLTVTAAESEYLLTLDRVYLTAHEVYYIRCDHMDLTAVPFGNRERFEQLEVFVTAVNKSDSEILGSKLFQNRLLFPRAVP